LPAPLPLADSQAASLSAASCGVKHRSLNVLAVGAELGEVGRVVLRGLGSLHHLGEELIGSLHGESKRTAGRSRRRGVGHLDRDDTAKGTCSSRVLAANEADVILAGHGAGAGLVSRDGRLEGEIGGSSLLFLLLASLISVRFVAILLTRFREFWPGGVVVTWMFSHVAPVPSALIMQVYGPGKLY
jgi:hypothetical protein